MVRRVIVAAVLLAALGLAAGAFLTSSAQAAPAGNCTYYSNASYKTVVGQYGYDCCNNRVAWGAKTPYVKCGGCFICYPPNP
ncbi:MAG: DUF6289 family protein [Candidatus Polarisedimenticolia bacterium]